MSKYFVILGAIFSLIACFSYIKSMFRGEAKPNKVSWLMWSIAPLIATFAGLSAGVKWAVLPVFMSGFSPLLIFILSFFSKKAYWKISIFDYVCGVGSVISLILWIISNNPSLAIIFAIISDGAAAIPTIKKSWNKAETENIFPFLAGLFSSVAALFVIKSWYFPEYAFPIYLIIINIILIYSIKKEAIVKNFYQNPELK